MATINSITIGKGSGKIGNIVFQSYNGKTYARQKNDIVSVPPTDEQIKQRNRIFNCSRSGSFLSDFMSNYKIKNQGKLSFQNLFVQKTSQDFSNFRALRPFQSIRQLAGKSYCEPFLIQISSIELMIENEVKTGVRVHFKPQIEQWEDNLIIYIMCTNIYLSGGTMPISSVVMREQTLTNNDWDNNYIDIQIEDFDTQFVCAYSRQYYTYSCNFMFSEIFQ